MIKKRLFPILETSEKGKQKSAELNKSIDTLFEQGRIKTAENLKRGSIKRLTILHGHWICNFRCPNYCYTRGTDEGTLTTSQTKELIGQAREMGAQVTYWSGNGEITLLKNFWELMEYQAHAKLPAVVFTNGSIFHNDKISGRVLGITVKELIAKLDHYNPLLHFYVKYWSSNPIRAARMAGVEPKEYPYETLNGHKVPRALSNLLEGVNKDRIGVEVMVSRENYEDVVEHVLPAIEDLGIYGYIEPVIFSGNAQCKQAQLSLTPEQHFSLSNLFASGGAYCEKRQSVELIVKGAKLTPGIAIPPRSCDGVIGKDGRVKDLFKIYHNKYFRAMRQKSEALGGCLCRKYWNDF